MRRGFCWLERPQLVGRGQFIAGMALEQPLEELPIRFRGRLRVAAQVDQDRARLVYIRSHAHGMAAGATAAALAVAGGVVHDRLPRRKINMQNRIVLILFRFKF